MSSSLMAQRFVIYGTLCRISGCLFIRDLRNKAAARASVERKGLYAIYSVLCVTALLLFHLVFMLRRYMFADIRQIFAKSVTLVLQVGLGFKVLINFFTIIRGASTLLAFLRKSELFEKTTGFVTCKHCAPKTRRWRLLRRFLTMAAFCTNFVVGQKLFTMELVYEVPSIWAAPIIIGGSTGAAIYFVYDSLAYLVLVPCCEVLGEYVHAQREAFHDRFNTQNLVSKCSSQALIEEIRLNMCRIKALKVMINDLFGWALFATFGGLIFIICLCLYALLDSSISRSDSWLGISYSVFTLSISLEIAFASQFMKDEARKLKDDAKKVSTVEATDAFSQQIKYFHDTLDPDEMRLNGVDCFYIDKALLVTITGTIITYSVILVQTSEKMLINGDARHNTTSILYNATV